MAPKVALDRSGALVAELRVAALGFEKALALVHETRDALAVTAAAPHALDVHCGLVAALEKPQPQKVTETGELDRRCRGVLFLTTAHTHK